MIIDNFQDLAEEIFFRGMSYERFNQVAILKDGKTFPDDIDKAMKEGRMQGLGYTEREFAGMARELATVCDLRSLEERRKVG